LNEVRVCGHCVHHEVIYAVMECKILEPDLDGSIAGSEFLVINNEDEVQETKIKAAADVKSIFDIVEKSGNGVLMQASTLAIRPARC
jgi:translation initiation factor 5B/PHD finger-like domain-containing protein 5A